MNIVTEHTSQKNCFGSPVHRKRERPADQSGSSAERIAAVAALSLDATGINSQSSSKKKRPHDWRPSPSIKGFSTSTAAEPSYSSPFKASSSSSVFSLGLSDNLSSEGASAFLATAASSSSPEKEFSLSYCRDFGLFESVSARGSWRYETAASGSSAASSDSANSGFASDASDDLSTKSSTDSVPSPTRSGSPLRASSLNSGFSSDSSEELSVGGAGASWSFTSRSNSPVRENLRRSMLSTASQTLAKSISGKRIDYVEKAIEINSTLAIKKQSDQLFYLILINGGKGQHSQIYHLEGSSSFYDGIPNENLLVKAYQSEVLRTSCDTKIMDFVSTSLEQYNELLEAKLPITKIYNASTAHEDGFFIVEKVTPLVLPWNDSTSKEEIETNHMPLLKQMKVFFDYAKNSTSEIPLDISADNFGINRENKLVLLDFMEHKEDDVDFSIPGAAFNIIKKNCLLKASAGNSFVQEFLDSELV